MRLATFNILHGRSIHDGVVDLDRLADAIRTLDPDIWPYRRSIGTSHAPILPT
jgi:endonuclease/exonuclease/phosphatase family metal-dependent hydrolase